MIQRLLIGSLAILTISLAGCAKPEFDSDAVKQLLESSPLTLSGEQVTLNQAQIDCGVQNDLWDPPSGNMARLTQKGRDLKFSDDVRIADPEVNVPYTQVNGSFPVAISDVSKMRDIDGGTKQADVKMGVVISHECFAKPLPVMGIKKGKFSPGAPVVFQFRGSGTEYTLDKLVH